MEQAACQQRERRCGLRPIAAELGVPRATLQDQRRAALQGGLPLASQQFFESFVGLHFVLRLVVVMMVVLVIRGGVSVTLISQCLMLAGLGRVVACSPSTLRRLLDALLPHVVTWGDQEKARRAKGMAPRRVVLAVDENFHWGQMLLVAVELATGYLFTETPSDKRDGETWARVLKESLTGMKVTLCALGRDGASGIENCAQRLAVMDGSDIFHIQHGVCAAFVRPMARREAEAERWVTECRDELAAVEVTRDAEQDQPRGPGRPIDWPARVTEARATLAVAVADAKLRSDERAALRGSIRALSDQYHPVDLETGETRTAEQVRERLEGVTADLRAHAAKAGLGRAAVRAMDRVDRCLAELEATVRWWYQEAEKRLVALALSLPERVWVMAVLMPAMYLRRRVALGRDKDERRGLRERAARLWKRVEWAAPWLAWSRPRRLEIQRAVSDLVLHFPRSTSWVEGRNGQDSLCMHQHHQISEIFRKARIVIHNDVIERPDGTTAGERLFGKKPGDLIEYLCSRVKLPGRGRRPRRAKEPPLVELVA